MQGDEVGRFFDLLTRGYTETIERCFPRYREMLWALPDYIPVSRRFESVLELGRGTGNLPVLIAEAFPDANVHLVDCGLPYRRGNAEPPIDSFFVGISAHAERDPPYDRGFKGLFLRSKDAKC